LAELVKQQEDTHSDRYAVCAMDGETFGGPLTTTAVTAHIVEHPTHTVVEYEVASFRFKWRLQEEAERNRPVYR